MDFVFDLVRLAFGSLGVMKVSINPQAMPLTKNVTAKIPEKDAAKCAEETLNSVDNPATTSPITAKIKYACCNFNRWFFSLFQTVNICFNNSNML